MSPDDGGGGLVIDLLDALESMVAGGRRVPMTANVMVNEEEALELIDRARHALPDDVKQARMVIDSQRELIESAEAAAHGLVDRAREEAGATVAAGHAESARLVEDGRAEADRMVREAQQHALRLVSEHAVAAAAQQRAAAVEADAAERSARVQRESEQYARDLLSGVDQQVSRAQQSVRRALEALPPG